MVVLGQHIVYPAYSENVQHNIGAWGWAYLTKIVIDIQLVVVHNSIFVTRLCFQEKYIFMIDGMVLVILEPY